MHLHLLLVLHRSASDRKEQDHYQKQRIFFPDEEITEGRPLKNWIKPKHEFYEWIRDGKIASCSARLKRGWYLADFSIGVDYTDYSTQVFFNDPLAPIIEKLRQAGKIGKYDKSPLGSRFGIILQEWPLIFAELAKELGFKPEQIRLERFIEFNAIGNLYDKNRGQFNMWEWFADLFEDSRWFYGGIHYRGGLADVNCDLVGIRIGNFAGRPLVSF